jgi:putative IMPACT (imprinted ancient) family translation regulator
LFEQVKRLVGEHNGRILDETFAADVTVTARFTVAAFPDFQAALQELSGGQIAAEIVETNEETIMPLGTM